MKRYLFAIALCLSAAICVAQPPRGGGHHPHHDRHDHHPQPVVYCATPEQVAMTQQVMTDMSFDDKKLQVAKLAVCLAPFCARDLAQLASVFSFDESRLAFLQFAYPYCSDPEHYPFLRDVFSFSSNYDKLMQSIHPSHR
ncbi:MAG: DUF4476 domain-containing protein [Paludibacteraceae bacterium]|nr:DUF4476 domain-containing protein [Paludibacteraceae bacterium]